MSEYDESDESQYLYDEFDSDEDVDLMSSNSIDGELDLGVSYTHPNKTTASGQLIDRMKYTTVNYEEIRQELEDKSKNLDGMLHLGWERCLILLLKYDWNDHKLMDTFMNSDRDKFLKNNGICLNYPFSENQVEQLNLLKVETDPNFACGVCYCGPDDDEPMTVFQLIGCEHKFCTDCYKRYIIQQNSDGKALIKCPFSDPVCPNYITISELKVLSDHIYNEEQTPLKNIEDGQKYSDFLTEEEVMNRYQREPESDDSYDYERERENQDLEDENIVFNYQLEMLQKERNERELKINKTLLSKYLFNITKLYVQTNSKNIKGCSAPDCDGMIRCLGFESDEIVNVEEMKAKMIIPIVQCNYKHRFCYSCNGEMDHAPCPCKFVESWKKKCKDDSETLNWISTNTKHCPKCANAIEKNGGCNHMTCRSCKYEFCWVCMGDWIRHRDNYNCDQYKGDDDDTKEKVNESKKLLEKYLFYFGRFDNQRTSYEKDKALVEKFEARILLLQKKLGVSYIDTMFYRECIDVLLMARINLMWSYAFLFFLLPCTGKSLMETAQWTFSNNIEALSHLFEHTKVEDVIKVKSKFLELKGKISTLQPKFLDMGLDLILKKQCNFGNSEAYNK